jgi:hypothetical protein
MSKEIDGRIDALRSRLIQQAATPISYGNYKQQLRSYQEMMLELINITDEVNATSGQASPAVLDQLRKAAERPADGET